MAAEPGGYFSFFCEAWPHVDPAILYREEYTRFLCDHMEALMLGKLEGNRLLINIPPGHSKSMICTVMSLPYLWTIDPTAYVIYAGKDQQLGRDMARKCRALVNSQWYQERWGHLGTRIVDDAKKVDRFSNEAGGGRATITVRQQITGMHSKGVHTNLIVLDDPNRPDETTTDSEEIVRWYNTVLPTRFQSLSKSAICIVQQRISQRDLSQYVLDSEDQLTHVNLPMHYDPDRRCQTPIGSDWRTEKGAILSPLRTTAKDVERLQNHFGDPRIAYAQLEQQPVASEGNLFRPDMFEGRYDVLPKVVQYTLSCDLTFTGKESSDYACIGVWAKGVVDGKHYLTHQVRRKMGFVDTAQHILGLIEMHRRANVLIEKSANGYATVEILEKAGVHKSRIHEFTAGRNSKEQRASTVSWLLDVGDVRFPRHAPWMHEYIREMTTFPAARHDDQVDQTTQYLAWVTGNAPYDIHNAFQFAGTMAKRIST